MDNYPKELTTSDWVDYLDTLPTRNEKIQALATYHRRIENFSRVDSVRNLTSSDGQIQEAIVLVGNKYLEGLEILPDYVTDDIQK